jgi:Ulp1 family protease
MMSSLVYPAKEDPMSYEINESCIPCLEPTEYLNDEVMNFYILYLKTTWQEYQHHPGRTQYVFPSIGFASTFLYTKVTLKNRNDESIVRWFTHFKLLSYDYSLIPVHDIPQKHWKLLIVDKEKQTIYLLDSFASLIQKNEDQMYIFLFILYLL